MSTFDPQDPMDRLRAANPIADGGAAPPPIDPLLRRRAAAPAPDQVPSSRTSRPRSGRVVRFGVVAGAVAVVAVAVGAVALTGAGGSRTDVVAEARAALAPRGEIVHTVVREDGLPGIMFDHDKRVGRLTGVSEQWAAADPLRTRSRTFLRQADGTRQSMDFTYAAGLTRNTQTWSDEVRVMRMSASQREEYEQRITSTSPTQLGPDPIQGLRTLLDDGALHADGTADFAGRKALRLVGHQPARHYAHGAQSLAIDVEYLVDPQTYAPLRLITTPLFPRSIEGYGGKRPAHVAPATTRITFERYERIPLTDKTATLLELDTANRRIVNLRASRLHKPR